MNRCLFFFLITALFSQKILISSPYKADESSQKIQQLLQEAQTSDDLEEWSEAFKNYENVLSLDSNNIAAKLGLELLKKKRANEASLADPERREKIINAVDHAWELPISKYYSTASSIIEQPPIAVQKHSTLALKLHQIKFPAIDFCDISLRDAIEQIQKKAVQFDSLEKDPNKKGVNIVLSIDPKSEQAMRESLINLSLHDVTLEETLHYMAEQANLKIKKDPYAIAFVSENESTEVLISKEYQVPPDFISLSIPPSTTNFLGRSDLSQQETSCTAQEFLISKGISFPTGASASYLLSSNTLLVKNNQANLDLIDSLLEASFSTPSYQVEIETRFMEVKQKKLQERGFDWLLGAYQLPFGTGVSHGGGTLASQASYNAASYPLQQHGLPVGSIAGGPSGAGSVTSGNRTGSAAITANALDSLLFTGPAGPTAGVLALAGIMTSPQFQVVLRAINQHKSIDLLSAPKVTVTSGKKATITVAREFPYPSDYSPPQIPQNQGSGVNPAVPATPSSFKTRNVGVQLEVEPTLDPKNSCVELRLSPQIVEFQGFINYGSPIFSQAPMLLAGQTNLAHSTSQVLLTENSINQPVFSVRQVDTQVRLHDGETVLLGGLMRDDVQKVEDKTPLVGDLPLVGKLFRSSSKEHIKRNLLIFVTVHIKNVEGLNG
ncbi:MAG: type II secretion system protein GspD [Chthoniobacterales bacterium]